MALERHLTALAVRLDRNTGDGQVQWRRTRVLEEGVREKWEEDEACVAGGCDCVPLCGRV